MKYIISIDGGIDKIQVVLFDLLGHEIDKTSTYVDIVAEGNRRETDMENYYYRATTAVARLVKQSEVPVEDVVAIGLTGQSGGLWTIDREGGVLTNAILNTDKRAFDDAQAVNQKTPGIGRMLHRNLGTPVDAGSTVMLLKWMKAHCLDIYRSIGTVFSAKDWLHYQMTGDIATEPTDGANIALRLGADAQAEEVLTVLGIPELKRWMPAVKKSMSTGGFLLASEAKKMRLESGIPVVMGLSNAAAGAMGSCAIEDKTLSIVLDRQSTALIVQKPQRVDLNRGRGHYIRHGDEGLVINRIISSGGTGSVDWMMREIARTSNIRTVESIIAEEAPGSGGLIFHPYITVGADGAMGSYFGMTASTSKARLMRAVYEGIGYDVRDSLETGGYRGRIFLSGKGAESILLPQIIADITASEVVVFSGTALQARGAAMAAAVAIGMADTCHDAAKSFCRVHKIYRPHHQPIYEKGYCMYKKLKNTFMPLWQEHGEMFDVKI